MRVASCWGEDSNPLRRALPGKRRQRLSLLDTLPLNCQRQFSSNRLTYSQELEKQIADQQSQVAISLITRRGNACCIHVAAQRRGSATGINMSGQGCR